MKPPRVAVVDLVHELTTTHVHREHYTIRRAGTWYGADHVTRVPSLIEQLDKSALSRRSDEQGAGGYGSKPAGPLEAVECLERIDREARVWIQQLGGPDVPSGSSLAARVRDRVLRLHGLGHGDAEVERDLRRWWTQARIVTGWDSPAWRPDNTCPLCGVRGGLRVRLADQSGFCAECGETWTPESISLLADHIRAESESERAPRAPREACACPWPKPIVADLSRLCPWCGSTRCVHAVGVSGEAS